MKFLRLINKFSSIGVSSKLEFLDATKVRILNQQAFIVIAMCAYFGIIAIGNTDFFVPLIALIATGLIVYLNYLQKWHLAAFYWTFIYPFLVVTCSYFYGEALRMDYVYTHFLLSVLFFLHDSKFKYFAIVIIFIAYLLSLYIMNNTIAPYAHDVIWFDKIIMFAVSILCTSNIIIALLKGFNRYYKENVKKQMTLEKLNTDLSEKAASLEKINVHLQKQVHMASHDLKTPLRSISGFTSLLQKESSKENGSHSQKKIDEYQQHIQENVSNMKEIIEEYMENSKEGVQKK